MNSRIKNRYVAAILRRHGWKTVTRRTPEGHAILSSPPELDDWSADICVRCVMQDMEPEFYEFRYGVGVWESHWQYLDDKERVKLARKAVKARRHAEQPRLWLAGNGVRIPYERIEDMHLVNILAWLRRNKPKSPHLSKIEEEVERRGFSTMVH